MVAYVCPCCGAPIGHAAPIEGVIASFAGYPRMVATLLARRPGQPVEISAIIDAMIGHRHDGGPADASSVAHSVLSKLRPRLARYGWTISRANAGPGNRSNYRLIPLNQEVA